MTELIPRIQSARVRGRRTAGQDKTAHRRRSRSHHSVSLLHQEPHQSGSETRCNPAGNYGGDLGRGRDAGGRCLRTFGDIDHRHGREPGAARTLSQSRGPAWVLIQHPETSYFAERTC